MAIYAPLELKYPFSPKNTQAGKQYFVAFCCVKFQIFFLKNEFEKFQIHFSAFLQLFFLKNEFEKTFKFIFQLFFTVFWNDFQKSPSHFLAVFKKKTEKWIWKFSNSFFNKKAEKMFFFSKHCMFFQNGRQKMLI